MQALVTGGAGFIGSSITRALIAQGAKVRVFDSLVTGSKENVHPEAEFFHEDLCDAKALKAACDGSEIIFHQAAIRSVPKSVDDPLASNEANVTGTLNLLQAASQMGVKRLVYASSSSAYGETGDAINVETMTPNPQSPYAVSKLAGEHYCKVWTKLGRLSTVSLRYFNVFGPGQHPESRYGAVFPALISSLKQGHAPEVHWDGEQSRDFCFIDDVVAANLAAGRAGPEADGETFNIGGGAPKSINEVLRVISDTLGIWIDPVFAPKRSGDIRHTRADISRAKAILGWAPRADWVRSVESTVEWFATI